MTATIKEFCRINGIDEASANLADIIYEALIGGDNGGLERNSAAEAKMQAAISNGIARTNPLYLLITLRLGRRHCSVETINRRIRSIKNKIADIVKG